MKRDRALGLIAICLFAVIGLLAVQNQTAYPVKAAAAERSGLKTAGLLDVKSFGAKGDGKTLDTAAINKAIDTAAVAGGGTVFFSAGNYLSVSIHLKSNIALYLD